MNTWKNARSGTRNLSHGLYRSLNRDCARYFTRMLAGARRPRKRKTNWLRVALQAIAAYIKLSERMAKNDPHRYGPHAQRYYDDTLKMVEHERQLHATLERVYGPQPPDKLSDAIAKIWKERYEYPPDKHKEFLNSFYEQYPPRPRRKKN